MPSVATPTPTCSSRWAPPATHWSRSIRAKEVCGECPVKVDCLDYALETNQDSGIWGGTSEEERRTLRRRIAGRERILV